MTDTILQLIIAVLSIFSLVIGFLYKRELKRTEDAERDQNQAIEKLSKEIKTKLDDIQADVKEITKFNAKQEEKNKNMEIQLTRIEDNYRELYEWLGTVEVNVNQLLILHGDNNNNKEHSKAQPPSYSKVPTHNRR